MFVEMHWENSVRGISELENLNVMNNFPELLYNNSLYYLTYYICPDCGKYLLYKVRARGVKAIFKGETKNLFNIFTCPLCKRFYASLDGAGERNSFYTTTRLSDFALRSIAYSDEQYVKLVHHTEDISSNF